LRSEDVVAALNHIVERRPAPKCLFVDNGSEFSGQLLDLWAYHYQAKIDFSRPKSRPTTASSRHSTVRYVTNA
jgi:putative transposase